MPSFGVIKWQAEDAVSAATAQYLSINEAAIVVVNATTVNITTENSTNATSKTRRLRGRRLTSIWAVNVRFRVSRLTAFQACTPILVLASPNSSQAIANFSSVLRMELINLGASPSTNFSITGLTSSSCRSFTTTPVPSGGGDQSLIQKPPEPTPPILSGPLLIVVIVVAVVVVLLVCCYCIVCRRKREPKGLDVMPDHQATVDLWRLESERWSFTEEVLGNEAPDPPLPKNWSGTWTASSSNSSSPPRPRRYMLTFQAGGRFDGSGEDPRGRFRITGGSFDIKSRKLYWREVFGEDGIVTEGVAEFRPKGGGKDQDDDEDAENVESWEIAGTLYAFDTSLSAHRLGSGRLCLSEAGTSGPPRGPPPQSQKDDRRDDRRGQSRDSREDDESDRRPLRKEKEEGSDNERHVAFQEDDEDAKPRHRKKQQTVGRRSPQSSPERDDEVDHPSSRQDNSGKQRQQQSRRSPQSSPEREEEEDVRQSSRRGGSNKYASRSPERSTRRGQSRQPERTAPHDESLERPMRRGSPRDDDEDDEDDEEEEQTSSRRR